MNKNVFRVQGTQDEHKMLNYQKTLTEIPLLFPALSTVFWKF